MKFVKNQLPLRRISKLWHVGSMNSADKGRNSIEGNGLSVSLHPDDWASIARLGAQVYTLTRKGGGNFLDAHALRQGTRQDLETWGVSQRWLEQGLMHELSWVDEDGDPRFILYADEAKANAEAEAMREEGEQDVQLKPTLRMVLTDAANQRIGFKLDASLAADMVATFWVEDCTPLDGVWWADRYDPASFSCPRGVICLKQLPQWKVSGPNRL